MKPTILSKHTVYALFSVFLIIPQSFAEQPDAVIYPGNNNLIPVTTPSYTKPTLTENIIIPGDVNGDGNVTEADAELVLQFAAGILTPTEAQIQAADLKGDGKLTSADAIKIKRIAAGLDSLPFASTLPLETTPTALSTNPIGLLLDVNGDGEVDNRDRDAILQYSIGSIFKKKTVNGREDVTKNLLSNATGDNAGTITDEAILSGEAKFDKAKADINGDGKINAQDAIVFLNLKDKTADEVLADPKAIWLPKVNLGLGMELLTQTSEQSAIQTIEQSVGVKNQAGEDTLGAIVESANKAGVSIINKVASAAVAAKLVIYTPVKPIVEAIGMASQERVDQIVTGYSEAVNIETNNDSSGQKTAVIWIKASNSIVKYNINNNATNETKLAAIEPLMWYLIRGNKDIFWASSRALEGIGLLAEDDLIKVFSNPNENPGLRQPIAVILGKIKSSKAVPYLINALGDVNSVVRMGASNGLAQIGDLAAIIPIEEALKRETDDWTFALMVGDLGVLAAKTKHYEVIDYLISMLVDNPTDNWKGVGISLALAEFGSQAVGPLIQLLNSTNDNEYYGAFSTLSIIEPEFLLSKLNLALVDNNPKVRLAVVALLGIKRDASSIAPVLDVLQKDTDELVRMSAAMALGRIISVIGGIKEKEAATLEILNVFKKENNPAVISSFVYAFRCIGISEVTSYIDTLCDKTISQPVREGIKQVILAIGSLSEIEAAVNEKSNSNNDPEVKEYLTGLLKDIQKKEGFLGEQAEKGIAIDEKIPQDDLQIIVSILNTYPPGLLDRLKKIVLMTPLNYFAGGQYNNITKTLELSFHVPVRNSIGDLFHEIAHAIDLEEMDGSMFDDFFKKSDFSDPERLDFADLYGATNSREDFATTVAAYMTDTTEQVLRGINQAQSDKPVYFEKTLFVLNVFTEGHPDYAIIYKTENNTVKTFEVGVMRKDGIITVLGGVNVYNPDGSYNFEGLSAYFGTLQF